MDRRPTREVIDEEIEAVQSIYPDRFEEKAPGAWQVQDALPSYSVVVLANDTELANLVKCKLHVTYPKTYPDAAAHFNITDIHGLSSAQSQSLPRVVRETALSEKGGVQVFAVIDRVSEWLSENHNVSKAKLKPSKASLAAEMKARNDAAEQDRQAAIARQRNEESAALKQEIDREMQERKKAMQRQEMERKAVASTRSVEAIDIRKDIFLDSIHFGPSTFKTFKVSFPRQDGLCTVFLAEPDVDFPPPELKLEIERFEFNTPYYVTPPGLGKLAALEHDLKQRIVLSHENILSVYASRLYTTAERPHPTLSLLIERAPPLSLQQLLSHSGSITAARAKDYLIQILRALAAIHGRNLLHRALTPENVFIASDGPGPSNQTVKLARYWYLGRVRDLHRSNTFGDPNARDDDLADNWLPPDVIQSRTEYTKRRDIWYLGLLFLQMIGGLGITKEQPNPRTALDRLDLPPQLKGLVKRMLQADRKQCPTAADLLAAVESTSAFRARSGTVTGPASDRASWMTRVESDDFVVKGDYVPSLPRPPSRYQQDWIELEFIGKGGFGSVVKARLKHDNRIYAIKKVPLKKNDSKIMREVNALAKMSHHHIVRYYTTWIEEVPAIRASPGPDDSDESDGEDGEEGDSDDSDGDERFETSVSRGPAFQGITGGSGADTERTTTTGGGHTDEILYIQMEYVENQTLREAIVEGISVERGWELLRQILDALGHIAALKIVHRDIKPENIFMDRKGEVKIGDFGLASMKGFIADPSDVGDDTASVTSKSTMTGGAGTSFYIAPELLHTKPMSREEFNKVDMYSLGVVFFEMNQPFSTLAERYHVLTDLRKEQIIFPSDWPHDRERQRQVIRLLLCHKPSLRPSAKELASNELLPVGVEEKNIRQALDLLVNPASRRYSALLDTLFSQTPNPVKVALYDGTASVRTYAAFVPVVRDRIAAVFRKHGAMEEHPPLLTPLLEGQEKEELDAPVLMDRSGERVVLPQGALTLLARSAAVASLSRIKRYFYGPAYRVASGQPRALAQIAFEIISKDINSLASEAECLLILDEIVQALPGIEEGDPWTIVLSHSDLVAPIISCVPAGKRKKFAETLENSKLSTQAKRAKFAAMGLQPAMIDEIEIIKDAESLDILSQRLHSRSGPSSILSNSVQVWAAIDTLGRLMSLANSVFRVHRNLIVRPFLMCAHKHFGNGVVFELQKSRKVIFARGGRYDGLIDRLRPSSQPGSAPIKAIGVQLELESLARKAENETRNRLNSDAPLSSSSRHSYGSLAPHRCDVYVIGVGDSSTHRLGLSGATSVARSGLSAASESQLEFRMRLVSQLWQAGISGDLMYDDGATKTIDDHMQSSLAEGILFLVWETRRGTYKIKNVLTGSECEEGPQDIVHILAHKVAEQKHIEFLSARDAIAPPSASQSGQQTDGSHSTPTQKPFEIGLPSPSEFPNGVSGGGALFGITPPSIPFSNSPSGTAGGSGGGGTGSATGAGWHLIIAEGSKGEKRKNRVKDIWLERASTLSNDLRKLLSIPQSHPLPPVLVADIPASACALLSLWADTTWMSRTNAGDATWKTICQSSLSASAFGYSEDGSGGGAGSGGNGGGGSSVGQTLAGSVGSQLREAIMRKRGEGWKAVVLLSLRDEAIGGGGGGGKGDGEKERSVRPFFVRIPPLPAA